MDSIKDLLSDIKNKQFRHVYLLYGPEAYLKLQYMQKLADAFLPPEDTMNRAVFEGDAAVEGEIIDLAETVPFFSERRLILCKDTGFFKNAAELLPDYMKTLPPYLMLVFTEDEVDKRNRLFKAVHEAGRDVEFPVQTEAVLEKWVLQMLSREGRRITKDDMQFFLSRVGTDMGKIYLETDKLISYTLGRDTVTHKDIEEITGQETENKIFDMIGAMAGHNRKRAFELYADLLSLKEPPLRILFLIARQFNQMMIVGELQKNGEGVSQIAQKAGIPSFVVRKYFSFLPHYSKEQMEEIVATCVRAEEDVKSGRLTDRFSVEFLLTQFS